MRRRRWIAQQWKWLQVIWSMGDGRFQGGGAPRPRLAARRHKAPGTMPMPEPHVLGRGSAAAPRERGAGPI
ncbi:MAG TPA: hypothetical protein VFA22_08815 [Stellaceae bacterium]|nr:hypothetical protein [Stellaceae bacterium]